MGICGTTQETVYSPLSKPSSFAFCTASRRFLTCSFSKMCLTCVLTVHTETPIDLAISLSYRRFASSSRVSSSRLVSVSISEPSSSVVGFGRFAVLLLIRLRYFRQQSINKFRDRIVSGEAL